MHNIVAVIAAHGRLPLLHHTITRLFKKNRCRYVVVVGGTDEKETSVNAGAIFIEHENKPLGKKWNAGFQHASTLDVDGVVFIGSSDWISDNWLDVTVPMLDEFDMIGKPDFYMADIGKEVRSCWWMGYGPGQREHEPIGIGRLISARIMHELEWRPFVDGANHSMDWSMHQKVLANGGKCNLITGPDIKSLSVSTDRWPNMHKFEDHWNDKVKSKSVRLNPNWLDSEFPEYKIIFS